MLTVVGVGLVWDWWGVRGRRWVDVIAVDVVVVNCVWLYVWVCVLQGWSGTGGAQVERICVLPQHPPPLHMYVAVWGTISPHPNTNNSASQAAQEHALVLHKDMARCWQLAVEFLGPVVFDKQEDIGKPMIKVGGWMWECWWIMLVDVGGYVAVCVQVCKGWQ